MARTILFLLAFCVSSTIVSQQSQEKERIKKVIDTFFEGLHKGDSSIVSKVLHKEIKIQTTGNRQGKKLLRTEARGKLLEGIASKRPTDKYFEKLLSYDIKIDGNLASVWTPYEFYYNDKFSHCGANSFQLFDNNGNWEIIYIVDMRRRGNCKALKDKK